MMTEKLIRKPSIYTKVLSNEICERIRQTESVLQICKDEHLPHRTTIYNWIADKRKENPDDPDEETFDILYARAFDVQIDIYFDKIISIAEEADDHNTNSINKAKLLVDTFKWVAARKWPKKYDGEYIRMIKQGEIEEKIMDLSELVAGE